MADLRVSILVAALVATVGCEGEAPAVEPTASKKQAETAAAAWTPEQKEAMKQTLQSQGRHAGEGPK